MSSDLATAVDTPPQSLENKKVKSPKPIRAVSRMQLLQEFTRTSLWHVRLTLNQLEPRYVLYNRWRSHQKGPICRIPLSTSPAVKYDDISLLTLDDPYVYTFKPGDRVFVKLEISLAHKFTSPRWYSGRVMKGPIEKEGFIYQEKAVAPAPVKSTEDPETKLPEIIRVTAMKSYYTVRVGLTEDHEDRYMFRNFCSTDGDIKPDNHQIRQLVSEFRSLESGWDRRIPFFYSGASLATMRSPHDPEPDGGESETESDGRESHSQRSNMVSPDTKNNQYYSN